MTLLGSCISKRTVMKETIGFEISCYPIVAAGGLAVVLVLFAASEWLLMERKLAEIDQGRRRQDRWMRLAKT